MKLHINENSVYQSDNIYYADSKGREWKYCITNDLGTRLKSLYKATQTSVQESNMSRIITHKNNACFMISACRGDASEKINKANTDKLAKDIRSNGLGYIRVLGGYVEDIGKETEKTVVEESFFVPMPNNYDPDEFFNLAITLCKKYNQDSVLISMPKVSAEGYDGFGYYDKEGNFDFSPGEKISFSEDSVRQYFSQLVKGTKRNVKWAFTETEPSTTTEWLAIRKPNSFTQAVLMNKNGENLLLKR